MTRILFASLAASTALCAFDNTPTVWAKGIGDKAIKAGPYRVNESDYNEEIHGALFKPGEDQKAIDAAPIVTANTLQGLPEGVTAVPVTPSTPNATSPATAPVGPTNPSPDQKYVVQEGKKHFVIDGTGARVDHPAIDAKGYADEGSAWNAVLAMQNFKPAPVQVQITDTGKV